MQDKYVDMQDSYVNMQHNYVEMQEIAIWYELYKISKNRPPVTSKMLDATFSCQHATYLC